MKVYFIRYENYALIVVEGAVEGFHEKEFVKPFLELEAIGCNNIIINFEKSPYISSLIIGIIINQWKRLNKRKGTLLICAPSPKIRQLFEITNLSNRIKIFRNEEEAVAFL